MVELFNSNECFWTGSWMFRSDKKYILDCLSSGYSPRRIDGEFLFMSGKEYKIESFTKSRLHLTHYSGHNTYTKVYEH